MTEIAGSNIKIGERASAATDVPGKGQLWVRDDAPTSLVYTDDAGNDHDIVDTGNLAGKVTYQRFFSSGTWTKPTGCKSVLVFVTGAGGGGAGTSSTNTAGNGGGGAGGTAIHLIDVTEITSETVTIGSGGAGATNGDGSVGGNSSFGTHANGLGGGGGNDLQSSNQAGLGGNGGNASAANILIAGGFGHNGQASDGSTYGGGGGVGGTSFWSGGGRAGLCTTVAYDGQPGPDFGSGGGGGNGDGGDGGDGFDGFVWVVEFY